MGNRTQTASVARGLIRAVAVLIFMFLPFLVASSSDAMDPKAAAWFRKGITL